MAARCDLVIPVYNEAERLAGDLRGWQRVMDALGIHGSIRVYDDGSQDETPQVLAQLKSELDRLVVTRQPNRGHGPTVLRGYREAQAEWIFQADGDGEVALEEFDRLWGVRSGTALVLGSRVGRSVPGTRRLVTVGARCLLAGLGQGWAPRDPNSPFRLWAAPILRSLLAGLPEALLVPNLVLTARLLSRNAPVMEVPVRMARPSSGTGQLGGWKLMRFVTRATLELIRHSRTDD